MYSFEEIQKVDPEIAGLIKSEVERQNSHIELIASENWVSKAVMAAMFAWMKLRLLLLNGQRSFLAVNM